MLQRMADLSSDDVRHIAKLARLTLKDEEVDGFAKELTSILHYIETLSEVDTSNVQPAKQVTGTKNGVREDEIGSDPIDPDALLATSPLPIIDHQIQTPSAHG